MKMNQKKSIRMDALLCTLHFKNIWGFTGLQIKIHDKIRWHMFN